MFTVTVKRNVVLRAAAVACALALAFAGGYWTRGAVEEGPETGSQLRLEGFRYINPLLECETVRDRAWYSEVKPQREVILKAIEASIAAKAATRVSVYYRDLKNGPWVGINERDLFTPSSLMKVPLMMTILKKAERDPSVLQRRITFTSGKDATAQQLIKPREELRPGASYTVDDLIFRMIAYSDNNASTLLAGTDGSVEVAQFMEKLRIPYDLDKEEDNISVRDYTSFFRVLFNASFLNHEMSERALGYLARSTFSDGIRAGLPKDVPAATKFGEYAARRPDGIEYELHELGIVYFPDHPYLLGIAARGRSFNDLPRVLRNISEAVYGEVSRQHRSITGGAR